MPNLKAALACAQLEQLDFYIENKRELSDMYASFLRGNENIELIRETEHSKSNYWLNAVLLNDRNARDEFLSSTNEAGIMTRPIWGLMNNLSMFENCPKANLDNAMYLEDRVVNITSSVRI